MPLQNPPLQESLLSKEKWDTAARYLPHKKEVPFRSPQEIATALLENPGRFHSPLSFQEKLQLKLFSASEPLDFFHLSQNFFYGYSKEVIPYSWQVLLRYLYREKILRSPFLVPGRILNDVPKNFFLHLTSSSLADITGDNSQKSIGAWGNALHFELALSRCVGELLERFFLIQNRGSINASVKELIQKNESFLPPRVLSHFSDDQKRRFSRLCIREDEKISWVYGEEILSRKKVLLPAQSVFWGKGLAKGEFLLRESNTNGAAGHFTPEEAILAGIYESVERDGFLIYWLNKLAPPVIDIARSKNLDLILLKEEFLRYKFELQFLNTTSDLGVPSFLCVLIDRSHQQPRVAIGGGSGWNMIEVLKDMAYKTLASYQDIQGAEAPLELPQNYVPFLDKNIDRRYRILLWQNPGMFPRIENFLQGKKQALQEAFPRLPKFKNIQDEYRYTLGIFSRRGAGYEIYVYKVENKVLERIGYTVIKVIIPELVPLYLHEIFAPLGASRLKTVPTKLGYTPAEEWNPWPHPFP